MWPRADTRRVASRKEIEQYFRSLLPEFDSEPGSHFADFPLHENERFLRVRWRSLGDRGFRKLTRAQQIICVIERVEGQINNGGIEQLFFNDFEYVDVLQSGVRELI